MVGHKLKCEICGRRVKSYLRRKGKYKDKYTCDACWSYEWKKEKKNSKQPTGVKSEFHAPCREKYRIALSALRFLCKFHNCDAIIKAIRKDLKK